MSTKIELKQFAELVAAVAQNLPRDLEPATMQHWIEKRGELAQVLRSALTRDHDRVEKPEPDLPNEMTVGGRTYDILGLLQEGEDYAMCDVMISGAKKMSAHLGEEHGRHILENQNDIPPELRGRVMFVFTDWNRPGNPEYVAYLRWNGECWGRGWGRLGGGWADNDRLLRHLK